jgi:hypothetical protein
VKEQRGKMRLNGLISLSSGMSCCSTSVREPVTPEAAVLPSSRIDYMYSFKETLRKVRKELTPLINASKHNIKTMNLKFPSKPSFHYRMI